jgi:hypothetical protein
MGNGVRSTGYDNRSKKYASIRLLKTQIDKASHKRNTDMTHRPCTKTKSGEVTTFF